MYSDHRDAYRHAFFNAWQKYKRNLALEPLEKELVQVILLHPEYHAVLDKPETLNQLYPLEENPFVHMSLHMSLNEQLRLDRPNGIKALYQQLVEKYPDEQEVIHRMIDCLAQTLWEAQKKGVAPQELLYLEKLRELL